MIDATNPVCLFCRGPLTKSYQTRFCGHKCRAAARSAEMAAARPPAPCKICGAETGKRHKPGAGVVCSDACLRESRRRTGAANAAAGKARPPPMTPERREAARQRLTGPNAPWWKGGRHITGAGYVMVIPPEGYPFPQSVGAAGRIREHRMVMELHLGRPLADTEVVHHINGDRADNRIENLEVHASAADHMAEHAETSAANMLKNAKATRSIPATCRTCGEAYRTNARTTGECAPCRSVRYEAARAR